MDKGPNGGNWPILVLRAVHGVEHAWPEVSIFSLLSMVGTHADFLETDIFCIFLSQRFSLEYTSRLFFSWCSLLIVNNP